MTPARHRSTAALAGLLLALAGCSPPERAADDARPRVVVSVLPQKWLVDRLAGDRVRGEVMVPAGANPATYEPSLAQLRALEEADLYVEVGHPAFPFERAWLERLLAEAPHLPVVDASAGIEARGDDPHVWVAPAPMARMAANVEAGLARLLPEAREELAANLTSVREEIAAVDADVRRILAGARGRSFVVFHPAWGAFARAYGLEQLAIEHEHKEPGPRELARLIEVARERGIRVIFVQPQFDPTAAETLAAEIGARVETLDPLAYDWPDNLRRTARALAEAMEG